MKVELKIQKDGVNTLKDEILLHSNSQLKKIYIVASDIKESGYDIVEECLIDLKARKFIALGIDKKNTTKKMLDSILKYTKNAFVWDNNADIEFKSSIFAFEYEDESQVYILNNSITDSMLDTDLSMYTKLTFDLLKDKKEYEEYIDSLTKEVKASFVKLTKEYIDELLENKLIFTTKQYIHNVPSIAELLGKKEEQKTPEIVEQPKKLPKIELDATDLGAFEIDLGDMASFEVETEEPYIIEEVENKSQEEQQIETEAFGLNEQDLDEMQDEDYVISDEVIDMEALVLESKVVKIDKNVIEKAKKGEQNTKKSEEKQVSKKINLDKVSNIIMELASKPTKGKDQNKIKVPNYIKDMVPQFFEIMEDAKLSKTDDGEYKEAIIKLEVIDVNNGLKHVDSSAKLRQKVGQTYVEFETDKLIDVAYEELDIARVIKLAKDYYHIEIIPKGIEEYNLWYKMCTNNFRGSSRQYGLM